MKSKKNLRFWRYDKHMLEIEKENEINFKEIYGKHKKTGEFFYDIWSEKYPIFENKDVKAWLRAKIDNYTDEGKNPQKFSVTSYLKPLYQYCIFNRDETNNQLYCDPSELLTENIDDRNMRLKKYMMFLMDAKDDPRLKQLGFKKYPSEESIRNNIQGRIKGFYSNRGVNISYGLKTRKSGANKDELEFDREIIKLIQGKLESANYRLICKFESQTGLRIGDVLDELPREIKGKGKYRIEYYKVGKCYFIRNFVSQKEMVVINYLFFTQELTELIQSITGINDLKKLDLRTLFISRLGNRINSDNYRERLKQIATELKIDENIKTHGLRKYFETQANTLIGARIPNTENQVFQKRFVEHLMGAEPNYRDTTYDTNLRRIIWFYNQWKMVERVVCVDCIIVDKTNIEIGELKQENFELRNKISELSNDMDSLKSKFRILDEAIKQGLLIEIFPDGVESGSPNDEPIGVVDKYVKVESKAGKKIAKDIIDKALEKE